MIKCKQKVAKSSILQPFVLKKLFVFEKLVKIAGKHTVVKLSYLIRLLAVIALEGRVGCDDVNLPGGE